MSPEFPMEAEALADALGIPLEHWPGNCHGIAEAILHKAPIQGMRLVRGHYTGWVSKASVYGTSGIQQHSWLRLEDGRILDPTRWAMVSPQRPFIYLGENDAYDEGGLEISARSRPHVAMSRFLSGVPDQRSDALRSIFSRMPASARQELAEAAGIPRLSDPVPVTHAFEALAELLQDPVEHLVDPATLYDAARTAGLKAFIKIDNWIRVMEPEKVTPNRGVNHFYTAPVAEEQSEMQKLFKVFAKYLSIEARDLQIEAELDEYGYTLDMLHSALNGMERQLSYDPELSWMDRGDRDLLSVVASDLLGKGFGQTLRVERFADSVGLDRNALHRAMVDFAAPIGYDLVWLVGDEARRAMDFAPRSDHALPAMS